MGELISERGPVGEPDEVCDVVVVGSGAAGLSAAVTGAYHGLDVVGVDLAARLGGATAWSGGWMFVPGNAFALADGVTVSPASRDWRATHERTKLRISDEVGWERVLGGLPVHKSPFCPAMGVADGVVRRVTVDWVEVGATIGA